MYSVVGRTLIKTNSNNVVYESVQLKKRRRVHSRQVKETSIFSSYYYSPFKDGLNCSLLLLIYVYIVLWLPDVLELTLSQFVLMLRRGGLVVRVRLLSSSSSNPYNIPSKLSARNINDRWAQKAFGTGSRHFGKTYSGVRFFLPFSSFYFF